MPLYDIFCPKCQEEHEIFCHTRDHMKCPNCGNRNVKVLPPSGVMFIMKGDPQGSTPGVRKRAREITEKTRN